MAKEKLLGKAAKLAGDNMQPGEQVLAVMRGNLRLGHERATSRSRFIGDAAAKKHRREETAEAMGGHDRVKCEVELLGDGSPVWNHAPRVRDPRRGKVGREITGLGPESAVRQS
jgi:hypothetical protein